MSRRVMHAVGAAGLIAGVAAITAPAARATSTHHRGSSQPAIGRLLPTPHEVLPVHGGTATSLNWSGYAVTPGSGITGVTTQFVVPSAALLPPGFAATWAGIGGYNTSDLIQAGVGENSLVTNPVTGPQYYAWYEILPAAETPISGCTGDPNCTVNPGDSVSVDIHNVGGNNWSVSLTDAGHWSWSQNIGYASSESSAEWILEAPTLGVQTLLANVGTVHFGSNDTYTDGSGTHAIAAGSPTQVVLSPGLVNEATPSNLAADGKSFNDCAYAQSCPTP